MLLLLLLLSCCCFMTAERLIVVTIICCLEFGIEIQLDFRSSPPPGLSALFGLVEAWHWGSDHPGVIGYFLQVDSLAGYDS